MACWRHHFPLLCVKQWHADVSTFHCVSLHTETHFVPDPHMGHVETDSVWRVIEGKWCFGSGIRIRYPDHHWNLMEWSLCSWLPSHYISFKSVHNFLSNPANRQTNKQTNRQTDKRGWIHNIRPTTLANVKMDGAMEVNASLWRRGHYPNIYILTKGIHSLCVLICSMYINCTCSLYLFFSAHNSCFFKCQ